MIRVMYVGGVTLKNSLMGILGVVVILDEVELDVVLGTDTSPSYL